ncbi:MAG: 4-hydroxy-tetrahydrodipicolinate synthase, partial [Gammaproteobacteria bacterium]|nr:4-hydroxy-tetrahydrodipicolinate synthase [Gammaproteobacteria bacterium]
STQHAIELTRKAQEVGADAALIVTPYYNNPPQKGIYEHYKKIAETVHFPIILYNVPGRTACDLLPETIAELVKMPNIIGIKEASGKVERVTEIVNLCGKNFLIYSGTDALNLDILSAGAQGVISVTANIAPSKMHQFCNDFSLGNRCSAEKLHQELMPLHKALFLQGNPIPVKWALNKMNRIEEGIRLPLIPLEKRYHAELNDALTVVGVLSKVKTFI